MGVKNRQRRAAKQRKRAKGRAGRAPYGGDGAHSGGPYDGWPDLDAGQTAAGMVLSAILEVVVDLRAARSQAEQLAGAHRTVPLAFVARALERTLADIVAAVVRGGWTPTDLGEVVRRRAAAQHLPALAALLIVETDRHRVDRVAQAWRDDLGRLCPPVAADLRTAAGLELALGLAGALSTLPCIEQVMPPPGLAEPSWSGPRPGADSRQLARVRALLAKAESTEYAEEADALSAKAQELISRHALDRLIQTAGPDAAANDAILARRLWIDAPYVVAKAMLIDAVASANRCQSVLSEDLGFVTVVGDPGDLEAVEVMATSLLVQANTAMLRHGRQADRHGGSRTRSFRRSFLVSYASRIGERLRDATRGAVADAGQTDVLLPVLRRRSEQVEAACEQMFPDLVSRGTTISNGLGWAAGRAAADLALLDTSLQVTQAAS